MADGDDKLLFGAAAPSSRRLIESRNVLDAVWVVVLAVACVGSSFFALVDLPRSSLRTGTEPFRVFAVTVPTMAVVLAAIGARRNSRLWIASATGAFAPAIAFIGALSASVFLSDDAALAEVGAAISLAVATVGIVMLIRWFVYHPDSTGDGESRPTPRLASALGVAGAAVGVAVVVFWAQDGGRVTLQNVVTLAFAGTVPVAIVVAAAVRTRPSFVLAATAAAIEVGAVIVARSDAPVTAKFDLDQSFALWLGLPGVMLLGVAVGIGVAGQFVHQVDEQPDVVDVGNEAWRWHADD